VHASTAARHDDELCYDDLMRDKVIIITGASAGIGAALAQTCAARGAKLVLLARREAALAEVAAHCDTPTLTVTADVTRRADLERAIAAALTEFGHIDVLVNNAGRGINRPVTELTDEDLDDMWLTNVKSVMYGVQAVLPHFQSRGRGHIVNVSSVLGRIPLASIRSAYNAAKHALNSLTANLRVDLRPQGIDVTLVLPGVVATEFGNNALHGGPDSRSRPDAQPVDEVATVIADVIAKPCAEVYTRPAYKQMIIDYFSASDLAEVESRPPFVMPR
jgi:NADP-dependent 3-hydroxy acid dehydrogenase YdfG